MLNEQEKISALQELKYPNIFKRVRKLLKEWDITPATDIRIFINYPDGWEAVLGANDRVYIITSNRGSIHLAVQPLYGFHPNGNLIRKDK